MQPNALGLRQETQTLHNRVFVVALAPLLLAVGLFAAYFAHQSARLAHENLLKFGRETTQRVSDAAAFDLATGNLPEILVLLEREKKSLGASSIGVTDGISWLTVVGDAQSLPRLTREPPAAVSDSGRYFTFSARVTLQTVETHDPFVDDSSVEAPPKNYLVLVLDARPIQSQVLQVTLTALGMAAVCLFFALLLAWRLSGSVSRPLQRLTHSVERISQGHLDERPETDAPGEIGQLQRGINRMAETLLEHHAAMQQRIIEATADLRAQKLAAESANQAKSRFLAAASHDLRQPLHAMSLLVEALMEKVPGGDARRLTEHIAASASAMSALLNALLDLSKLDAGVIEARPACTRLQPLFEGLHSQFAHQAVNQGLKLGVHDGGLCVDTDPLLLERILANLLSNALRYTQRGGIVLGARRSGKNQVRIEVWDTGQGIPAEYQDRVFEEYFQLDNPERYRDKGLGLGLAIVNRLGDLLRTQVRLRSRVGSGSCFHLVLPRCEALPAPARRTPSSNLNLPLEQALVAFIDDDPAILEAMVEVFDQWGVELAVGEDAEQMRDELVSLGRRPDVVLSDYRLKDGKTGIEAIAVLRRAFGPMPAALLTGDTAPETIQAIRSSALPVLHKPLKPAKLRAFLAHLLSSSEDLLDITLH